MELRGRLRDAGLENVEVHSLDSVDELVSETEIIVNTTPLGMKEEDDLPILARYVEEDRAFCDAVYRPGTETPLVRLARERGVRVVAGDRMLLYQGVLAQKLWTGREPNVKVMDRAIS